MKANANFKIYHVTAWQKLQYNFPTSQQVRPSREFVMLIECNARNIFFQKSFKTWGRETNSRPPFAFKIASC